MTRAAHLVLAAVLVLALVLAAIGWLAAPMPGDYAISVAAFPLGALVAGLVLTWRGQGAAVRLWSVRLVTGLVAGLLATAAYDLYRVAVSQVMAVPFDPFRVQPEFGRIVTGLPSTHLLALAAGWAYHLWVGGLLGMVFAALRPRGGAMVGAAFIAAIQIGRWLVYPDVFRAGLADSEFVANGVVGMLLWGAVLGAAVAWLSARLDTQSPK